MSIKKNKNKLIISAIAGVIVALLCYQNFASMQSQIETQKKQINTLQNQGLSANPNAQTYLVAAKNIAKGQKIKEDDLKFKTLEVKIGGGITNKVDVVGAIATNDINEGGILTEKMFEGKKVDPSGLKTNYRAVSVPYEKIQGLSSYIKPLTYVDIYSTSQNMPYSIDNIRIMSFDKEESGTKIKTITFEIPKYEVPIFVEAMSSSKLLLVSRGADEPSSEASSGGKGGLEPPRLAPLVVNDLEALPAPMSPKGGSINISPLKPMNTVEIIQANTKTQVVFD